jgi:hypothetical protein
MNKENSEILMLSQPPIPDTHPHFVTIILATTVITPPQYPHHHALIFTPPYDISSQIRKSKPENKIPGLKYFFYKSPAPKKRNKKASPFFADFLEIKIQRAIFGGSDLEIKPLIYIDRRFYIFQFIFRNKIEACACQNTFYKQFHRTL